MDKSDSSNMLQFTAKILVSALMLYFAHAGLRFVSSARGFAVKQGGVIPGNSNGTILQVLLWFWIVTLVLEIMVSIGIYTGCIDLNGKSNNDD